MEYGVKSQANNCMARNIDLLKMHLIYWYIYVCNTMVSYKIQMFAHNYCGNKNINPLKIRLHEFACPLNHKNLTNKVYYTYAIKNLNIEY